MLPGIGTTGDALKGAEGMVGVPFAAVIKDSLASNSSLRFVS